jgi:hypothetical protein
MDRDAELEIIRRAYAKQIMAGFGVSDRRIETAFASVKHEYFLGRGTWQIVRCRHPVADRPACARVRRAAIHTTNNTAEVRPDE